MTSRIDPKAEAKKKLGRAIAAARAAKGLNQTQLGEALGVGQAAVSSWERGVNEPDIATLRRLSELLATPNILLDVAGEQAHILILGFVAEGQKVVLAGDISSDLACIEAPPTAPDGAEAVEVKGNAMLPVYRAGQVLVFWRKHADPSEVLGELCVVNTAAGELLVKVVERGSVQNRYNLTFLTASPLQDVALEWAAPVEIVLRRANWRAA